MIYVLLRGTAPIAARTSLADAQKATEDAHSRYMDHPTDYRWDEETRGPHDGCVWQLRVKGLTGRWAKAYRSVHEVPTS
ncbi:hypothetical protein [Kitasatospora azatica]|uniref:hypothetical protein n=1 Tax=Kitasatospora azatica TaxID=58347 RepID=UPI00055CF32E|nr:hypothetical protein [Kitasatospora azatica]